jgi:hypothetical protein
MENIISKEKIEKYFNISETAFKEIKKHIINGKEKEAKEIIDMVENYISDAHHFFKNNDWVNSFASLNYSHGWIDSGVRLKIFDVHDDKLFTVCD